jgi:hypothetical protein
VPKRAAPKPGVPSAPASRAFGHGACIALDYFDGKQIVILAVRHSREAGV